MANYNYLLKGAIMALLLFPMTIAAVAADAISTAIPSPTASLALTPAHDKTFGTWFWRTSMIETSPQEVLSFLEEKQVNEVYLQINQKITAKSYKAFIEKATDLNIKVYALDGAPNWVSPEGEKYRQAFFAWVQAYQKASEPAQQFQGIHLDVEPYLYSGWKDDYQQTVSRFQDLIVASQADSQKLQLKLMLAVPFWYDNREYANAYGEGNLARWVIEHADEIAIMAYRDQAKDIIKLAEQEIAWAQELNKQVIIGAETKASAEGEFITFYEEGSAAMYDQLEQVYEHYRQMPSFKGFAIHSLKYWMELKP